MGGGQKLTVHNGRIRIAHHRVRVKRFTSIDLDTDRAPTFDEDLGHPRLQADGPMAAPKFSNERARDTLRAATGVEGSVVVVGTHRRMYGERDAGRCKPMIP